ncbi:MAG: serine hydrolase domain-containing protein, partial [Planctomycetota bacterium]
MYQRYLAYTLAFLMLATCSMNLQGQQEVLIDAEKIERFKQQVRRIVDPAIGEGKMPGCVIGVGNRNGLFYQEAFGNRSIDPILPMTLDTVFDLASITKPVATATSIMQLIEQGQLRLNDKVATHFPDFAVNGKEPITIEHLLLHTSGLIPDNPLADY